MSVTDRELKHIITKARDAKHGGFGVLSTGEKLAAALVLNRPDWLAEMTTGSPRRSNASARSV
ncbi:hypothetical protein [Sinorhizobium fredii]|uniref:hypothetical protein n=1 Tax=Rhizobium fredii TaxID=380 RepID=UPI0035178DF2